MQAPPEDAGLLSTLWYSLYKVLAVVLGWVAWAAAPCLQLNLHSHLASAASWQQLLCCKLWAAVWGQFSPPAQPIQVVATCHPLPPLNCHAHPLPCAGRTCQQITPAGPASCLPWSQLSLGWPPLPWCWRSSSRWAAVRCGAIALSLFCAVLCCLRAALQPGLLSVSTAEKMLLPAVPPAGLLILSSHTAPAELPAWPGRWCWRSWSAT